MRRLVGRSLCLCLALASCGVKRKPEPPRAAPPITTQTSTEAR